MKPWRARRVVEPLTGIYVVGPIFLEVISSEDPVVCERGTSGLSASRSLNRFCDGIIERNSYFQVDENHGCRPRRPFRGSPPDGIAVIRSEGAIDRLENVGLACVVLAEEDRQGSSREDQILHGPMKIQTNLDKPHGRERTTPPLAP